MSEPAESEPVDGIAPNPHGGPDIDFGDHVQDDGSDVMPDEPERDHR